MQPHDRKTADLLVDRLLALGYSISVNDDYAGHGDFIATRSTDARFIKNKLGSTCGDSLFVYREGEQCGGIISLVYNNGPGETIADYRGKEMQAIVGSVQPE